MTFDDQLHIATPEGVDLELTLAGLGSRISGVLLDQLVKWVAEFGLIIIYATVVARETKGSTVLTAIATGILIVVIFAIDWTYDVAFEVLGGGKTLGKRAVGTRVIRMNGAPVDFRSSAIRNLLRIVDGSMTAYIAGVALILFTPRHQRLGDLAAGTVVIRDRQPAPVASTIQYAYSDDNLRPWDVGAIDRDILATLRNFLARRDTLSTVARSRIAADLYGRIRPLVGGVAENMSPEAFIEEVVRLKSVQ